MNLFEVTRFSSPIGGAAGIGFAIAHNHNLAPKSLLIMMLPGVPIGLVCGYYVYFGLLWLACSKQKPGDQSAWRAVAQLGGTMASPFLAGLLCFGMASLILALVA